MMFIIIIVVIAVAVASAAALWKHKFLGTVNKIIFLAVM
jgi:hypothetical protein